MDQLIYRNRTYFIKRKSVLCYHNLQYRLKVSIEREGFWRWLFPYKTIIKAKGYSYVEDEDLIRLIESKMFLMLFEG